MTKDGRPGEVNREFTSLIYPHQAEQLSGREHEEGNSVTAGHIRLEGHGPMELEDLLNQMRPWEKALRGARVEVTILKEVTYGESRAEEIVYEDTGTIAEVSPRVWEALGPDASLLESERRERGLGTSARCAPWASEAKGLLEDERRERGHGDGAHCAPKTSAASAEESVALAALALGIE
jgi:hypothetical protein